MGMTLMRKGAYAAARKDAPKEHVVSGFRGWFLAGGPVIGPRSSYKLVRLAAPSRPVTHVPSRSCYDPHTSR